MALRQSSLVRPLAKRPYPSVPSARSSEGRGLAPCSFPIFLRGSHARYPGRSWAKNRQISPEGCHGSCCRNLAQEPFTRNLRGFSIVFKASLDGLRPFMIPRWFGRARSRIFPVRSHSRAVCAYEVSEGTNHPSPRSLGIRRRVPDRGLWACAAGRRASAHGIQPRQPGRRCERHRRPRSFHGFDHSRGFRADRA